MAQPIAGLQPPGCPAPPQPWPLVRVAVLRCDGLKPLTTQLSGGKIFSDNRHPPSDQVRGQAFSGSCPLIETKK